MSEYVGMIIAGSGLVIALLTLALSQRYHCRRDDRLRGQQDQRVEDHERRLLRLEHTRDGGR